MVGGMKKNTRQTLNIKNLDKILDNANSEEDLFNEMKANQDVSMGQMTYQADGNNFEMDNTLDLALEELSSHEQSMNRMSRRNVDSVRRQATGRAIEEQQKSGKDILEQIVQEEMEEALQEDQDDERFEMNMQIVNTRAQMASVLIQGSAGLGAFEKSSTIVGGSYLKNQISPENSLHNSRSGSMYNQKPNNARFSTAFDDRALKGSLVDIHRIQRKLKNSEIQQQDLEGVHQSAQDIIEIEDEDSLGTEEDLEMYLAELEEEEKRNKEVIELQKLQKELLGDDAERGFKLSDNYKFDRQSDAMTSKRQTKDEEEVKESGKDLFDAINEVEEGEEDAFDSDDSITKQYYQTMHQEVLMLGTNNMKKIPNDLESTDIFKDDWEFKDMIRVIDWNERRYQEIAKQTLKTNSVLAQNNNAGRDIRTKVMSNFTTLNSVTAKLNKEKSYSSAKSTCVGLSEDLLLIGSSEGQVWMFDRESEEDYAVFTEKSKEFLGNAVTAIDVHPNKTEYIVLGFERGQIVLFDCTDPKKSIKVIKDHHKNTQIVNIKFCDWSGFNKNKDLDKDLITTPTSQMPQQLPQEDMQAWMFISIDKTGKVIVNSVYKQLFMLKASKHVIIDPATVASPEYSEVACRFKSQFHGQGVYDELPMIAIGNNQDIKILEVRHNNHYEISLISKPTKYFNRQKNILENFWPKNPSLSWGHGHSPVLKERPHKILAIGWGPLIQLVVLIDHEETTQPFIQDGYHILRNFNIAENRLFVNPRIASQNSAQQFPEMLRTGLISAPRSFKDADRSEIVQGRNQLELSKIQQQAVDPQNLAQLESENKVNGEEEPEEDEEEILLYDESNAFKWPELFIEQIQFISDSTLMVITQNQEVRILHTAAFNPDVYKPATLQVLAQKGKSLCSIEQTIRAELEHGVKLPNVIKSVYHQTLKFFHQKLVVLTDKNIQAASHLTWKTALYDFKKEVQDDLILVFQRALDIYRGKIKGYAGIPDFNNVREISLKADLKLLIREIICQVIEKTQETNAKQKSQTYDMAQPVLDYGGENNNSKVYIKETLNKIAEFEDERRKKYQTLIRISIEFCVELKDCYFLFYDLFLLFKDEQLEDLFIKELEPFIMAGKFQEWELPNEVLQSHVIKYYKNDKNKADALEKIIVNLNFNQCPKTIVLEFIHFSEQNYLTTALLFLYTQVIEKKDNTSCVQVLCSLFDLYKKSSKKNNVSMIDLQMLREFDYDAEEKKQVEQSQIYLGYKILWIIRLFIDGKKFPQGNIREKKWRSYIHDVIQFLETPEYLKVLLEVDAESFFRVISILFYQSKPFELVEQGRDEINNPSLKSQTHLEFLKELDATCLQEKNSEHIKYQYLFFVANVVAKSTIVGIDQAFFYKITKELLTKHRRYLEFNKGLQEMTNKKRMRIYQRLKHEGKDEKADKMKQIDELKYIQKTESDFLNLFRKSEPLDTPKIQELLKLSEFTQFNQLKTYLLEKKEEYIRCLQLLLNDNQLGEGLTEEQHSERVMAWIKEKLYILEERAERSQIEKNMFEQFKREVAQHIKKMVQMNSRDTIQLVEEKFGGNHKEMIDSLQRDPLEQMIYLETLLEERDLAIQDTIRNYGLQSTNPQEAKRYIEFLKMHLRLCCQHQKHKVINIVEKMVKNTYYPIQDCLVICQENNQIEAAFLLNKKLGKYFDAVNLGIQIMKTKVDLRKLKVELYFALKKEIPLNFPMTQDFMAETVQFDQIFKQILKICRKNSKEVEHDKEELVWYIVIDTLMEIKNHSQVAQKSFCRVFFQKRLNIFMEALVRVISFNNFINYILSKQKDLRFKDFQEIIQTIFNNLNSENVVIQNANNAIFKVNTDLFQQFSLQTRRGILYRYRMCTICKRYVDSFLYDDVEQETGIDSESDEDEPYVYDSQNETLKIFACKHAFHIRCLQKYYKQKPNEIYDVFLRRTEKLRCPTCNLKNFEIESNESQQKSKGKKQEQMAAYKAQHEMLLMTGMNRGGSFMIPPLEDDPVSRKMQLRQIRQTMKSVSIVNKKLQKLSKSMEFYEQQYDMQAMNINDFKKIR